MPGGMQNVQTRGVGILLLLTICAAAGCTQASERPPAAPTWAYAEVTGLLGPELFSRLQTNPLVYEPVEVMFPAAGALRVNAQVPVDKWGYAFSDSNGSLAEALSGKTGYFGWTSGTTIRLSDWQQWYDQVARALPTLFLDVRSGTAVDGVSQIRDGPLTASVSWDGEWSAHVTMDAPGGEDAVFTFKFLRLDETRLIPVPQQIEWASGRKVWELAAPAIGDEFQPKVPDLPHFAIAGPGTNSRWPTPATASGFPFTIEEALDAARNCRDVIDECDPQVVAFVTTHFDNLTLLYGWYEEQFASDAGAVPLALARAWQLVLQGDQEVSSVLVREQLPLAPGERGTYYSVEQGTQTSLPPRPPEGNLRPPIADIAGVYQWCAGRRTGQSLAIEIFAERTYLPPHYIAGVLQTGAGHFNCNGDLIGLYTGNLLESDVAFGTGS